VGQVVDCRLDFGHQILVQWMRFGGKLVWGDDQVVRVCGKVPESDWNLLRICAEKFGTGARVFRLTPPARNGRFSAEVRGI